MFLLKLKYTILIFMFIACLLPVALVSLRTDISVTFADEIQAGIDEVYIAGGGTIHIAEGDMKLDGEIIVRADVTLMGAGPGKTILRTSGARINVTGDNTRVSGLSIISTDYDGGKGINIKDSVDYRIDNCQIEGYSYAGVFVDGRNTRGVIDHCTIKMTITDGLGYGVAVLRDNYWEEDIELGSAQATFIEDCTIINARHAVAANGGAHYVFRYNHVIEGVVGHQVDAHGMGYGSTAGTRAVEVYGNIIENPVSGTNAAAGIRGGTGVIFGNTFRDYGYGVILMVEDNQSSMPYPVPHQVHDLYIWGNSYNKGGVAVAKSPYSTTLILENRDYFLYAKPGYTPYTYPHPLTQNNTARQG